MMIHGTKVFGVGIFGQYFCQAWMVDVYGKIQLAADVF
jgi:hypothetical protein